MKKTLEIELLSDLCAGTGKHYAAVIDLDTALDAYGVPYIPAKRIKGCMRELARQTLRLEEDTVRRIFGERGAGRPGSLRLTDARIRRYDDQLEEIGAAVGSGGVRANEITELFCSVRAETAVENDTAKEGSLRFTRVVNRLSPVDGEPLRFYAGIESDDADSETVELLCRGLRNLGYKRNRGLGLVRCSLLPQAPSFTLPPAAFEDGLRYRLSLLLYLNEDLMLPAADADRSMDCIPGASVLGAFAEKYVKRYGNAGFGDLFFSGGVRFGNLYVSDRAGNDYVPAPGFLAVIKAATREQAGIRNMIAESAPDVPENEKPRYKPLKKGYVSETGGYREARTGIVYHNALNTAESRERGGGLYAQVCVSAGQYFRGDVIADGKSMKKLYPLLADGELRFGRSKTAQYSLCTLRNAESVRVEVYEPGTVRLKAGDTAAFLCESDAALLRDGRYTAELPELCAALNAGAGARLLDSQTLEPFTSLTAGVVSGYNAKWNLKKPQFPVVRKGSAVVFRVKEDLDLPLRFCVGARQGEGYGQIRLIPDAKRFFAAGAAGAGSAGDPLSSAGSELLRAVRRQREADGMLAAAVADAAGLAGRLNASQTGRLTLMCRESACAADLEKRIAGIKSAPFRRTAEEKLLKAVASYGWENDWSKARHYILSLLTVVKYRLREEGKQ